MISGGNWIQIKIIDYNTGKLFNWYASIKKVNNGFTLKNT